MLDREGQQTTRARNTVFVHGVMQRSGTNYLMDLLSYHEDCHVGKIYEDFISSASPLLARYAATLSESWNPQWFSEPMDAVRRRLVKHLGRALVAFLSDEGDERRTFVTKTPSTLNLKNCFSLFPDGRIILIVRDGRDVVESGVRTFGWEWEFAVRQWTLSAGRVLEFLRERVYSRQVLLVRYEDLFRETRVQLLRILAFLDLDTERFDWKSAERCPVRGSCAFGRSGTSPVDWRPVARNAEFVPLGRYRGWSKRRRQRFEWLAGRVSAEFGYAAREGVQRSAVANALDWTLDRYWQVSRQWKEIGFLVRRALRDSRPDFSTGIYHYYERRIGVREQSPSLLSTQRPPQRKSGAEPDGGELDHGMAVR